MGPNFSHETSVTNHQSPNDAVPSLGTENNNYSAIKTQELVSNVATSYFNC